MPRLLESYAAGRWFTAEDEGRPLLDASTGEEVFRLSAQGLDLGEMTSYARSVGGPALRALTFHERAGMLKELGKHLMGHVAEFHELSLRTGATKGDGMGDIEGGIGTLFASGSVGTRQMANSTVHLDGDPIPLGKGGTFVGQHVYTSRPGVMVQINAFNFPVWGMLEKLGPAFLAGMPSIVKPAAQTSYVTEAVVRRIVESGIVPEGSIQLLMGSPAGLLDELQVQDHVAFTGSAHTAGLLRTHANVLHGGVTLGVEADSLNCSILGPDVTADDPELDLFVKGVVTEMTYKAGRSARRSAAPSSRRRWSTRSSRRSPPGWPGPRSAIPPPRACGWARWSASTSARRCGRRSSRCGPPPRSSTATRTAPATPTWSTPTASAGPSSARCCCAPARARSSRTTSRRSDRSAP